MLMKTLDISGMGDSYEEGCQRILWLGLEWIKDKPLDVWDKTYTYKDVSGILETGEKMDGLEKILSADEFLNQGGMTGAMHQFSLNHLYQIHKNGYLWWLGEGEKMGRIITTEQEPSSELLKWLNHSSVETVNLSSEQSAKEEKQ